MSLVLADTSIWVAHFRHANPVLQSLVAMDRVLCHPLVLLELACGTPPAPRQQTLADLGSLQQAAVASTGEVLALIEKARLHESGCGAVDVALLASVLLTPGALLWTEDKSLLAQAGRLGVAFVAVRQ